MQEHIRRAHPEHYISKLPATEESFLLMINTPPSERPPTQASSSTGPSPQQNKGYLHHDNPFHRENNISGLDDYPAGSLLPAASAAAALAQLHSHNNNLDVEWDEVSHSSPLFHELKTQWCLFQGSCSMFRVQSFAKLSLII